MARWDAEILAVLASEGPALHRYAVMLSGDHTEAEDLVQEALVRLLAGRRIDSTGDLVAYARRAIFNLFVDRTRRIGRWRLRVPTLAFSPHPVEMEGEVIASCDVAEAMASLSPRQRACLVARYFDDLPVDEVAARLGCSPG